MYISELPQEDVQALIKENREDEKKRPQRKKEVRELKREIIEIVGWHKGIRNVWMSRTGTDLSNKANLFIQPLMFRSLELMESVMADIKAGRLLSAYSSTRTHFELTGSMAYLLRTLRKYKGNEDTQKEVLDVLKKLTMGVGKVYIEEFTGIDLASIHVNNRIRAVDEIEPLDSHPDAFWKFYSDLCEFGHINYNATHMTIRYFIDGSVCLYDYDKILEHEVNILRLLSISSGKFWFFYREAMYILDQKEAKMPQLLKLPKLTYNAQRLVAECIVKLLRLMYKFGAWKPKKKH